MSGLVRTWNLSDSSPTSSMQPLPFLCYLISPGVRDGEISAWSDWTWHKWEQVPADETLLGFSFHEKFLMVWKADQTKSESHLHWNRDAILGHGVSLDKGKWQQWHKMPLIKKSTAKKNMKISVFTFQQFQTVRAAHHTWSTFLACAPTLVLVSHVHLCWLAADVFFSKSEKFLLSGNFPSKTSSVWQWCGHAVVQCFCQERTFFLPLCSGQQDRSLNI